MAPFSTWVSGSQMHGRTHRPHAVRISGPLMAQRSCQASQVDTLSATLSPGRTVRHFIRSTAACARVLAHRRNTGALSLMDAVLRKVIEDVNLPVAGLLTFKTLDLQQVCLLHHIDLLNAGWDLPESGRS